MFDNIGAVLKRGEMIESESCIVSNARRFGLLGAGREAQ